MKFSRRTFLGSTAAMLALPNFGNAAVNRLTASEISAQILPSGQPQTDMLGFNGVSPGPEIRVKQGEAVRVQFQNGLQEGSAIHWHGIRLNNAMDGVPVMTQDLVNPGDTFDYSFTPPDAGTYWYHSHYISYEQVARGLYGPLIVEEQTPPDVDHDITAVIDDWRVERNGQLSDDFGNRHDMSHGGRMGNFARAILSKTQVQAGDRIRLRMINAATARVFPIKLNGLEGKVVALDGMAVSQPLPLSDMVLAPAQRMDVIVDVVGTPEIVFASRDGDYLLRSLSVEGTNTERTKSEIPALPQPDLTKPNLEGAQKLTMKLQGGAMGRRHGGDDLWALNDVSGLPSKPFGSFKSGETALITLVNDSSFPHGMHLHGHHFREVNSDGSLGNYRDTTLVAARQSQVIACVFDNSGKWLFHCHMLGHQAAGMKTWVAVA